jgi:hypothetical protein
VVVGGGGVKTTENKILWPRFLIHVSLSDIHCLNLSFITYNYFRGCFPTCLPCFGYFEGSYPGPTGSAPAPEIKCKYMIILQHFVKQKTYKLNILQLAFDIQKE